MKHYAHFYYLENGSWREPLGSFCWIRLDGRLSRANMEAVAAEEARKRGYQGWRLARGDLRNPFYLTAAVRPI